MNELVIDALGLLDKPDLIALVRDLRKTIREMEAPPKVATRDDLINLISSGCRQLGYVYAIGDDKASGEIIVRISHGGGL